MSKDNGTKTAETTGAKLTALLAGATAADLAEIDQEISKAEDERAEAVGAIDARLASLRALRKIVDVKVNGKAARKKPVRKVKGPSLDGGLGRADGPTDRSFVQRQRRVDAAKFLAKAGPTALSQIANQLDIPQGSMFGVLDCPWFKSELTGYRLTEVGRKEAGV